MRFIRSILLPVIALAVFCSGCPRHITPQPPVGDALIIEQLASRRLAMNPMEADVGFTFIPDTALAPGMEGHGAYMIDSGKAMLRVVAMGPLGFGSMDLLVIGGNYLVKAPGMNEPLSQEDLLAQYGDSPIVRAPAVLAKRPGIFFGGIPEGIGEGWTIERDGEDVWLVEPGEGGARFRVEGEPARIARAELGGGAEGGIIVDMLQWLETDKGPVPSKLTVTLDGKVLFSMKVSNPMFGQALPERVFEMGGKRPSGGP